ncbi:hypothetical protein MLC52_05295 [Sulfurimonas sp. NW15]|uniref:hypothetical protein n=1 Tax=Sulfurimonas sp. NW15 TaxID=2922729 RepID=UPI003DA7F5C3
MINENSIEVQLKELNKTVQLMMEKMEAMEKELKAKATKTDHAELVTMLKQLETFIDKVSDNDANNLMKVHDSLTDSVVGNAEAVISYVETAKKFIQETYAKIEEESQKLNRSIGATQNTTRFS